MTDTVMVEAGVDQLDASYERWLERTDGNAEVVMDRLEAQMRTGNPDGNICARLIEGPIVLAGRDHLEALDGVAAVYRIGGQAVMSYFEASAKDDTPTSFEGLFRAINIAFEEEVRQDEAELPDVDEDKPAEVERPRRTKEELDRINRENLKKANFMRTQRSQIKKQIASMERTIEEILEEADEAVAGMRVKDALECLPSHGHPKDICSKATRLADKIMMKVNIFPEKTFGTLTKRQIDHLLDELEDRGFC